MNESALLALIAARSRDLQGRFEQVIEGPGDDFAVIATPGRLLLTVDQLVESRHFRPGTPIDLIARKAIARSISDIAAMAGTPLAALATGVLPAGYPQADADLLCQRLKHWAEAFDCPLVGGDIAGAAGAKDPLVLTVTVVGTPHPSRGPVLRRTARVGDGVYVTGALGGSFDPATGLGRHLTFAPRVAEAIALADQLGERLHAMMDISDGLGRDAARIARDSKVAIELLAAAFPCSPVTDWTGALRDGEDYELLFTAAGPVPALLPSGAPVTKVGQVVATASGKTLVGVRTPDGRTVEAADLGWDHAD